MASPNASGLIAQATQEYGARRFDDSFRDFERAANTGRPSEGYYGMGVILHDRGQLDAAESYLLKSLAANNMNADAYYHLGRIAEKRQHSQEAQGYYAQAIRFNPKYEAVIRQLARPVPGAATPAVAQTTEATPGGGSGAPSAGNAPAPHVTNNPMESELGVYEFLRGDAATPNRQAIQVIQLLRGQIKPRQSAYIDVILMWSLASVTFALLIGSLLTALTYHYVVYGQFAELILVALTFGVAANYDHITFPARSRHWFASVLSTFLRVFVVLAWLSAFVLPLFSGPGVPLIPNPFLVFILGLLFIAAAIALIRRSVDTTQIMVDKGRLQIESGIVARTRRNIEFWRIDDITVYQSFTQRFTHDGTLVLTVRGQVAPIILRGITKKPDLDMVAAQFLNLAFILRAQSVIKGVIS